MSLSRGRGKGLDEPSCVFAIFSIFENGRKVFLKIVEHGGTNRLSLVLLVASLSRLLVGQGRDKKVDS
jgi:hypothetical protein